MDETSRKWPRLRFSLRTFFVVLTALAVWLGWKVYEVRQRHRMENYVQRIGSPAYPIVYGEPDKPWKSLPVVWRIFGVKPVQRIYLLRSTYEDDKKHIETWFPEAEIVLFGN